MGSSIESLAARGEGMHFSGSALLRRQEIVVLDRAHGLADRGTRRVNAPHTIFQIASVSKQFAAAAVLLAQDMGLLAVADPVSRLLAGLPHAWRNITIHHLLTHTAGVSHWEAFPDLDDSPPGTDEELLRIFVSAPLVSEPGTRYYYSSPGYVVLAHIVERAFDQPYAALLRSRLFEPLDMKDTCAGDVSIAPTRQAVGYEGNERVPSFNLGRFGVGAGDIWSTTHDLALWNDSLRHGRILSDASRRTMLTPHVTVLGLVSGLGQAWYGYGVTLGDIAGDRLIYHTGDNPGFLAFNAWFGHNGSQVILLSNQHAIDLVAMGMEIVRDIASTR